MNKTLMAAGLAVILGACSSSKKSDVAEGATPNPFLRSIRHRSGCLRLIK